jgi:imidazolonepropionase-like amidohydrolase
MASSRSIAIVGGHVLPVSGDPIPGATVLVLDGRVAAVGSDVTVPAGVPIIDAAGSWVLPGLVDAHTHVGITEESIDGPGADSNESSRPNAAGVRAIDAVNIDDDGFRDALMGGITTVNVKPGSGNPFGGLSVTMKTWGGRTIDEQAIVSTASLKSALGENPKTGGSAGHPQSRLGIASQIRQGFENARHYAAQEKGSGPLDLDLEALALVLAGELPWDVHAHRRDDIVTAMRISEEFGLRLVLNHGTEAGPLGAIIAERGIPVIVGPIVGARLKPELSQRSWATAAELQKAGVQIAIMTDHPETPVRSLAYQTAIAVGDGLDATAALRAITTSAAAILGLDERIGALAPGMDGDVAIWSGDPLDARSRVSFVVIDGVPVFENGKVVERA